MSLGSWQTNFTTIVANKAGWKTNGLVRAVVLETCSTTVENYFLSETMFAISCAPAVPLLASKGFVCCPRFARKQWRPRSTLPRGN